MKEAYDSFSSCASSVVRLYYSIMTTRDKDTTYLAGIQDLWAIVEATCGILAICLPLSPKFFNSLQRSRIWETGFKIPFHHFTRSRIAILRTSDTRSDKIHATANPSDGSSCFNARHEQDNYLSKHDVESNSTSSDADGERTLPDDHWTKIYSKLFDYVQLLTFSEGWYCVSVSIFEKSSVWLIICGFGIAKCIRSSRYISYSIPDMILLALINDEDFWSMGWLFFVVDLAFWFEIPKCLIINETLGGSGTMSTVFRQFDGGLNIRIEVPLCRRFFILIRWERLGV